MSTAVHYAQGKKTWGMCARSGARMLLRDMTRDPLTGLLVDPAWAERPLMRPAVNIVDAVAVRHPSPRLDRIETTIYLGKAFDWSTGGPLPALSAGYGGLTGFGIVTEFVFTYAEGNYLYYMHYDTVSFTSDNVDENADNPWISINEARGKIYLPRYTTMENTEANRAAHSDNPFVIIGDNELLYVPEYNVLEVT